MLATVAVLIGGYFFVQLAGYAIHWALHRPELGPVHKTHNDHHRQKYSIDDFFLKPTAMSPAQTARFCTTPLPLSSL